MKRIMILVCLIAIVATLHAQIINDPNAEVRIAKDFHVINVASSFDVFLTQGNDEAVAVSAADTKTRDLITVEVKNGVLSVGLKNGHMRWKGNMKLKAYISLKTIDKLVVSGSCDVFIQGALKTPSLKIDVSGASDLKGKIVTGSMIMDVSGSSDVNLSGSAAQLTVDVSGASTFKGGDFETDICDARASGSSDILLTVNKELSANASGASDVRYKGNGTIRQLKTNGSSSVKRL